MRLSDTEMRELQNSIGHNCVQQIARAYSARSVYMAEIVR